MNTIIHHLGENAMGWRTIIITKHSKLSFAAGQVLVKTVDQTYQVPLSDINILLVETTQATLTSFVIQKLIKNNVRVLFCDENYIPVGEIAGYYNNSGRIRNIEGQIAWLPERKNQLWQQLITLKMLAQQQVLMELGLDNDNALTPHILNVLVGDTSNREAVVARMYFTRLFGKQFSRRDDSNLINAHLNYGYQIILAAAAREIQAAGYLTEIGIHHKSYENALNFASDVMEPLRPIVDRLTWQFIKRQELDFSPERRIELVDILNFNVRFKEHETLVTGVLSEILRDSLQFLNHKGDSVPQLPDWKIEI